MSTTIRRRSLRLTNARADVIRVRIAEERAIRADAARNGRELAARSDTRFSGVRRELVRLAGVVSRSDRKLRRLRAILDRHNKAAHSAASVRYLLERDADAVERSILKLYEYQTAAEREAGVTAEDNGVGFSGADAELLSSFAEQIKAGRKLSRREGGQLAWARKKMLKYARQLAGIANAEARAKHAKCEVCGVRGDNGRCTREEERAA